LAQRIDLHRAACLFASMTLKHLLTLTSALSLLSFTACDDFPNSKTDKADNDSEKAIAFASTYESFSSGTTLIENAHIFDGLGGEIQSGYVLISEGRITSFGEGLLTLKQKPRSMRQANMSLQASSMYIRILAITRHLVSMPIATATKLYRPIRPMSGQNTLSGLKTPDLTKLCKAALQRFIFSPDRLIYLAAAV